LTRCPHCRIKIRAERLEKHISKSHQSVAQVASAAAPAPVVNRPPPADNSPAIVTPRPPAPAADAEALTPFTDKSLRDWFFELFTPDTLPVEDVATVGFGPFSEQDLDDFFRTRGLEVYMPGEHTETVVVGRDGWDGEDLKALLDARAGNVLKVYSQEMFLAYLGSCSDPLEDEAVARRFGQDHPALDFLSALGFDWPKTIVSPGEGEFTAELPQVGLLKHLGYTVGRSGLDERKRREVLRYVFDSPLPTVVSADYMRAWGAPKSAERLQKMANSLATFCRNAKKRKSAATELAVTDWECDLDWLKRTFYTGRFRFQWPSIGTR
jgi:hypothetical protein